MRLAITLSIGALLLLLGGAVAVSCNGGSAAELPEQAQQGDGPGDAASNPDSAPQQNDSAGDGGSELDEGADDAEQPANDSVGENNNSDAPEDSVETDAPSDSGTDDGSTGGTGGETGGNTGSDGGGSSGGGNTGGGGTPIVTDGDADEPEGDSSVGGGGDSGGGEEEPAATIAGIGDAVISDDGSYRYISASGVPTHDTGQFPGPGNPNAISAQNYSVRMPLHPVVNATATPYYLPDPFGIGINGVMFDPYANEFYNGDRYSGWQEEPMPDGLGLDHNHGHVQPNGAYHYHGMPTGLIEQVHASGAMALVGFAADGFPVYALYGYADALDSASEVVALRSSYRLKSGTRPGGPGGIYDGTYIQDYEYVAGLGDLDECNGRFGVTAEFPLGTYYYVITEDYPYIPRMFRGTPDSSFDKGGPPN